MAMNITGRDGYIIGSAIEKVIAHLREVSRETVLGTNTAELTSRLEALWNYCAKANPDTDAPPADFRDLHLTALYLAIQLEQAKPKHRRAWSDMQDMKAVLLHHGRAEALQFVKYDEQAGERPADLIDERSQPRHLS